MFLYAYTKDTSMKKLIYIGFLLQISGGMWADSDFAAVAARILAKKRGAGQAKPMVQGKKFLSNPAYRKLAKQLNTFKNKLSGDYDTVYLAVPREVIAQADVIKQIAKYVKQKGHPRALSAGSLLDYISKAAHDKPIAVEADLAQLFLPHLEQPALKRNAAFGLPHPLALEDFRVLLGYVDQKIVSNFLDFLNTYLQKMGFAQNFLLQISIPKAAAGSYLFKDNAQQFLVNIGNDKDDNLHAFKLLSIKFDALNAPVLDEQELDYLDVQLRMWVSRIGMLIIRQLQNPPVPLPRDVKRPIMQNHDDDDLDAMFASAMEQDYNYDDDDFDAFFSSAMEQDYNYDDDDFDAFFSSVNNYGDDDFDAMPEQPIMQNYKNNDVLQAIRAGVPLQPVQRQNAPDVEPATGRGGLLQDIRKGIHLRKVEPPQEKKGIGEDKAQQQRDLLARRFEQAREQVEGMDRTQWFKAENKAVGRVGKREEVAPVQGASDEEWEMEDEQSAVYAKPARSEEKRRSHVANKGWSPVGLHANVIRPETENTLVKGLAQRRAGFVAPPEGEDDDEEWD